MVSIQDIRWDRVLEQLAVHVRVPAWGVCARTKTDAAEGVVLESAHPDRIDTIRSFVCLFGCGAIVAAPPKLLHEEEYVDDLQEQTNRQTDKQAKKQTNKQTNTQRGWRE